MRFLHTSDVHIGAKFEVLGPQFAREHREQIKTTFSDIVGTAIKGKVDLFLIAGDLFDSNSPSFSDVEFVKKELSRFSEIGTKICIIPGNHDYALSDNNALGGEFLNIPNVHIFTDPAGSKIYFKDINTEVYAKANTTNKSSESPLVPTNKARAAFKIVMAHGGVLGQARKPQWPIDPGAIEASGADYVALGDWHSFREESRGKVRAFYPGSPEMISVSQAGAGYVILGEIKDRFDRKVEIHKIKVGTKSVKNIEIDTGDIDNVEQLKESIKSLGAKDIVLNVNISGVNKNKLVFNPENLEEELEENFWRLQITDNSKFPLDDLSEEDYPRIFVSGQFVEIMKEHIEKAPTEDEKKIYEEALQLGLLAFKDPKIIE